MNKKMIIFILSAVSAAGCATVRKVPESQLPGTAEPTTFDPAGTWRIDTTDNLCVSSTSYSSGISETVRSDTYQCTSLSMKSPMPVSSRISVSYDQNTNSIDVTDNERIRRMSLTSDELTEHPTGRAAEPLSTLDPEVVAPGCTQWGDIRNVPSFTGPDTLLYGLAYTIVFISDRARPNACAKYLRKIGGAIQSGGASDFFMDLSHANAIDLQRIEYLTSATHMFVYRGTKIK